MNHHIQSDRPTLATVDRAPGQVIAAELNHAVMYAVRRRKDDTGERPDRRGRMECGKMRIDQ